MSIHRASSSSWGSSAGARLCQVVVEANTGIAQQIAENRTDLLDILPASVLSVPTDDLGLTPAFLAIYYDRPDMIAYLHKRGVDFSKPCDPMEFGTPLFYAISLGRSRLICQLDMLGASIDKTCDRFGQLPIVHAQRLDDQGALEAIQWAAGKEKRAAALFYKHWQRLKCQKMYRRMRTAIPLMQRIIRGMLGRIFVAKKNSTMMTTQRREARRLQREAKLAEGIPLGEEDEDTETDEPEAESEAVTVIPSTTINNVIIT